MQKRSRRWGSVFPHVGKACYPSHSRGCCWQAVAGSFKPSLKLVRMRPRTASNHCKHRQPQTSENHEQNLKRPRAPQNHQQLHQNMLQTFGSRQSTCLNHSLLDITPAQSQSTNQETSQAARRPTDRRTGPASQSATNQPTNNPASRAAAAEELHTGEAPLLEVFVFATALSIHKDSQLPQYCSYRPSRVRPLRKRPCPAKNFKSRIAPAATALQRNAPSICLQFAL